MAYQRRKLSPRIRSEEYDEFLAIINDSNFPDSFDIWESKLLKHHNHSESQGFKFVEIVVHAEEFADWCSRSGLDPSWHSLNAFTVAKAEKRD